MRGHIYVLCLTLLLCLASAKPIDEAQSSDVATPETSNTVNAEKRDDITEAQETSEDDDESKTTDQQEADEAANTSQVEEENTITEEGAKKDTVMKAQQVGKRRQYNGAYHPDDLSRYDDNVGYTPDGYNYGPNSPHDLPHTHSGYHAPYGNYRSPHNGYNGPHGAYVGATSAPHRAYGYPGSHNLYGVAGHGAHSGEHGHHNEGHHGQGHENHDHGFEFYEEWGQEGGHQHGHHGHEEGGHRGVHTDNGFGPGAGYDGPGYGVHGGHAADGYGGGYGPYGGGDFGGAQHGHEGHGHEEAQHGHHGGFKHEWGHHEGGHEGESEHVGGEHDYGEHGFGSHGYAGTGWSKSSIISDGSPKIVWGEMGRTHSSKLSERTKIKAKSTKASKKWYTSNGGHHTHPGVSHWGPPVLGGGDHGGWHYPENGFNGLGYGAGYGDLSHTTGHDGRYADVVNAPAHPFPIQNYGGRRPGFIHVGYGTQNGHLNGHAPALYGYQGGYPVQGAHHVNLNDGIGDGVSYSSGHPLQQHPHHHHSFKGPWSFGVDHFGDDWANLNHAHGNYHHLNGIGIVLCAQVLCLKQPVTKQPYELNGFSNFSPFSKTYSPFLNGKVDYISDANFPNPNNAIGLPVKQENAYDITLSAQPTHASRKTLRIHCDVICNKPRNICTCKKDNVEATLLNHLVESDSGSLPPSQSILSFHNNEEEFMPKENREEITGKKNDNSEEDVTSWWNDFKFNSFPQPFYSFDNDKWSKKSSKASNSSKRGISKRRFHGKKPLVLILRRFISPLSSHDVKKISFPLVKSSARLRPFSFFTFLRFHRKYI